MFLTFTPRSFIIKLLLYYIYNYKNILYKINYHYIQFHLCNIFYLNLTFILIPIILYNILHLNISFYHPHVFSHFQNILHIKIHLKILTYLFLIAYLHTSSLYINFHFLICKLLILHYYCIFFLNLHFFNICILLIIIIFLLQFILILFLNL